MAEILIVNRKEYTGKVGVYIGRPSVLGNPFSVKQHGRGDALELYKQWLNLQWKTNNRPVIDELFRLADILKEHGSLTLICWCAPAPCHGDLIAKAVKNIVENDLKNNA